MKHLLLAVSFIVPFFASAQDGWKYIGPEEAEVRNMIIDGDLILCSMTGSKPMYRSTDAGQTWAIIDTALFPTGAYMLERIDVDPSVIVASLHPNNNNLYTTHDGGETWDTTGTLPYSSYHRFYTKSADPTVLFEVVRTPVWREVLFRSTDLGQTWTYIEGFPSSTDGATLRIGVSKSTPNVYLNDDTDILGAYFYRSTDAGITWTYQGPGLRSPTQVVVDADDSQKVYCTSANHIYTSNDGGSTWIRMYSDNLNTILTLLQDSDYPDNMYLLTEVYKHPSGVYGSIDRGKSWTLDSSSSSLPFKPHLNSSDPFKWLQRDSKRNRLYLQTKKGIYVRNGPITGVELINPHVSSSLVLYPQPARENLNIKVTRDIDSPATIRVYNTLGILVYEGEFDSQLVTQWNLRDQSGSRVPDGIYFIQIWGVELIITERLAVFR